MIDTSRLWFESNRLTGKSFRCITHVFYYLAYTAPDGENEYAFLTSGMEQEKSAAGSSMRRCQAPPSQTRNDHPVQTYCTASRKTSHDSTYYSAVRLTSEGQAQLSEPDR